MVVHAPAQRRSILVISFVVWLAFVAFDQASARRELERRFTLRAVVGARFVQTWVEDLFRRQEEVASTLAVEQGADGRGFPPIVVDSAPGRGSTFWFDVAFDACVPDSHAGSIGNDEDRASAVQRTSVD